MRQRQPVYVVERYTVPTDTASATVADIQRAGGTVLRAWPTPAGYRLNVAWRNR